MSVKIRSCYALVVALRIALALVTEDRVREQYERFPYPYCDPSSFATQRPRSHFSDPLSVSHRLFGGELARFEESRPFRVLIAGCGTGTALLSWAFYLSAWYPESEIVAIDLSQRSLDVTRERVAAWESRLNVSIVYVRDSILNLQAAKVGTFDFINCVGVLHHLENPAEGLRQLEAALKPSGGMVLMVYAPHGRAGLYAVQEMARLIGNTTEADRLSPEVLGAVRDVLDALPEEHLLGRYRAGFRSHDYLDTDIVDDFLHAQDRAYTVTEVHDLLRGAGLRLASFAFPLIYEPLQFGLQPTLREVLLRMTRMQRAQFAEHHIASFKKHVVYAVKSGNSVRGPVPPISGHMVPVLRVGCSSDDAARHLPSDEIAFSMHQLDFRFQLPPLYRVILAKFDGHHTLSEIVSATANVASEPSEVVQEQVEQLVGLLSRVGNLAVVDRKLPNREVPVNEEGVKCNWRFYSHT